VKVVKKFKKRFLFFLCQLTLVARNVWFYVSVSTKMFNLALQNTPKHDFSRLENSNFFCSFYPDLCECVVCYFYCYIDFCIICFVLAMSFSSRSQCKRLEVRLDLKLLLSSSDIVRNHQGPNFRNFPKIFFKDLFLSDDLGIPKKFTFLNFWWLSLRFQRTSYFFIFLN